MRSTSEQKTGFFQKVKDIFKREKKTRRRILLTIAYDGTAFSGFQRQPSVRTVQGDIEIALSKMTGGQVEVVGASRTDAGVHALGARAHFDLDSTIPTERIKPVLNRLLPQDIAVTQVEEVDFDFHARFSVTHKCYTYKVYRGDEKDVFAANYSATVQGELNIDAMRAAAQLLIGVHNFQGFCGADAQTDNFTREIYAIDISQEGDYLIFNIVGNGFLYNMVRIIVGSLIDVGRGRLGLNNIRSALNNRDRSQAGVTMPANGLYLAWISYEDIKEEENGKID